MKKLLLGLITGVMIMGGCMTVSAAEFTVTEQSGVCYSNDDTIVYADADLNGTVVLPDVEAGLPICVTGITSNGFFRVDLGDGNVYYIPGNGLSATADESASTTTATTDTTTAIPAKVDGKYVCVIEDSDTALFREYLNSTSYFTRGDYTDNDIYIAMRDQLEAQIAAGAVHPTVHYTCQIAHAGDIFDNLALDLIKAYPQYQHHGGSVGGNPEYTTFEKPFRDEGDRLCTYGIYLTSDPQGDIDHQESVAQMEALEKAYPGSIFDM